MNRKHIESITDFGSRQLNHQNFSRTVVLPKTALANLGYDLDGRNLAVSVKLVQNSEEKYIKLTPTKESEELK